MPTHHPLRRSIARLVLALSVLAAIGLATSPVGAQADSPRIEVSQTSGFDPSGETTITVAGYGFTDTATGTRPPLAGQPGGVYVVFGRLADVWRPSEGAPSAARQVISQRWALPAASLERMGADPAFVLIEEDGSFTTELTVRTAEGSGTYAVFTYAGSGGVNAAHELAQVVTFQAGEETVAPAEPAPTEPTPTTQPAASGDVLPQTGNDGALVVAALALIVAGLAFTALARTRPNLR